MKDEKLINKKLKELNEKIDYLLDLFRKKIAEDENANILIKSRESELGMYRGKLPQKIRQPILAELNSFLKAHPELDKAAKDELREILSKYAETDAPSENDEAIRQDDSRILADGTPSPSREIPEPGHVGQTENDSTTPCPPANRQTAQRKESPCPAFSAKTASSSRRIDSPSVNGTLRSLLDKTEKLLFLFETKITDSEKKKEWMNQHFQELELYKKDFPDSLMKPLLMDIISLVCDIHGKISEYGTAQDPTNEKAIKILTVYEEELEYILEKNGIETYQVEGDIFDRQLQKPVMVLKPSRDEDNRKVARKVCKGFRKDGIILRYEQVVVYQK